MPFTVEDWPDLLRLLAERPEWRSALRQLVLTEELLELPGQMRAETERLEQRMLETHQFAEQKFAELAEALAQLSSGMGHRLERLEGDTATLKDDVAVLKDDVAVLKDDVAVLKDDMGEVKGESLERKYSDRAAAYLARLALRVRPVTAQELADLAETAREEGHITKAEWEQLLVCDLVARGRSRNDGSDIYLVAEVSWGIGPGDVERARTRADLLHKVTRFPCWPVVAGKSITAEAREDARMWGVWVLVEGQPVVGPETAI